MTPTNSAHKPTLDTGVHLRSASSELENLSHRSADAGEHAVLHLWRSSYLSRRPVASPDCCK